MITDCRLHQVTEGSEPSFTIATIAQYSLDTGIALLLQMGAEMRSKFDFVKLFHTEGQQSFHSMLTYFFLQEILEL